MRIGFGLVAGSLVLACAAGASLAGPPQGNATAPPSRAVSGLRVAPPGGVRQSVPVAGVSAMSTDDCTDLGGTVITDMIGVCASKKVCVRTDNQGQDHAVCISATK